jgi:hypothetical protein
MTKEPRSRFSAKIYLYSIQQGGTASLDKYPISILGLCNKGGITTTKWPVVSVIVLGYNGGDVLLRCLESVLGTNYPDFEIVLVDNASSDGSAGKLSRLYDGHARVRIVRNATNVGFASGNNIGVRHAQGEYVAFLNQDTIVHPNWLCEAITLMQDRPKVGILQCKLVKLDDPSIIDSAGHYINPLCIAVVRGHGEKDTAQFETEEEIFGANGAAMVMRKHVFEQVGGFDSSYFMTFEESDLCWRTWLMGYKVMYAPVGPVYHKSGFSRLRPGSLSHNLYYSRRNRMFSMLKNYERRNMLRYFPLAVIVMFVIGLVSRGRGAYMRAYIHALADVIASLRSTLTKRYVIQRDRRVPDAALIGKVIKQFTLAEMKRLKAY